LELLEIRVGKIDEELIISPRRERFYTTGGMFKSDVWMKEDERGM
jgi:hypothetical protein